MLNFKNTNIITVFLLLIFIYFKLEENSSFLWLIGLIIGWLSLTTLGSFNIKWNYFINAKHHNHTTKNNEIALTFDDGPNPIYTLKVLNLLKKYNAKATFFCIGKNIEKYPEIIKKITEQGHLIGNHSYKHSNNYGFMSTKKVIKDITKTQMLLKKITNIEAILFRPPFGVTNPNIANAIKKLNLQTIGWSIRSYDTVAKKATKVFKRVHSKIQKGSIILLHDTSSLSVTVLEQLLQSLEKNKIKSVTINQLFNNHTND